MTPHQVAVHEIRHGMAYACALSELADAETYLKAGLHIHVGNDGTGEAACLLPDGPEWDGLRTQVAQLGSFGPIAAAGPDIVKLMRSGDSHAIKAAGSLSDRDEELAAAWAGAPLLPAVVVLATHELEKRLGIAKFERLVKTVKDLVAEHAAEGLMVSDLVPLTVVQEAVAEARQTLDKAAAAGTRPRSYQDGQMAGAGL